MVDQLAELKVDPEARLGAHLEGLMDLLEAHLEALEGQMAGPQVVLLGH